MYRSWFETLISTIEEFRLKTLEIDQMSSVADFKICINALFRVPVPYVNSPVSLLQKIKVFETLS